MPDRLDPYGGYTFTIELDGITCAGFRECSGLESSHGATDYRAGTDRSLAARKLPGMNTDGDVTLSRGIVADDALWKWRERARSGAVDRRDISITFIDDRGRPRITWNLFDCWPRTWTGPSFDATADAVAVEQMTLAYERIEVDDWR